MDSQLRRVCFRADVVEHAVRVARLDEATLRRRENQACVAPQRAGGDALSELALPIRTDAWTAEGWSIAGGLRINFRATRGLGRDQLVEISSSQAAKPLGSGGWQDAQ